MNRHGNFAGEFADQRRAVPFPARLGHQGETELRQISKINRREDIPAAASAKIFVRNSFDNLEPAIPPQIRLRLNHSQSTQEETENRLGHQA